MHPASAQECNIDSILSIGSMKHAFIAISQTISPEHLSVVVGQGSDIVSRLLPRHQTFWAFAVVSAGHQGLFRVVTNIICQDRMALVPDPIPAHHWQSSSAVQCNRA